MAWVPSTTRLSFTTAKQPAPTAYSTGVLVRRLLELAWRHPAEFLQVLGLQALLLTLGLAGVNFIGIGIDY